jgi:hypothetical protein
MIKPQELTEVKDGSLRGRPSSRSDGGLDVGAEV